jgi:hypothetical protein
MYIWIKEHMMWILGFLIVACIILIYLWVDSRVSLDYARQEQKYQHRQLKILQSLLQETGKRLNRSEIKHVVIMNFGKDFVIKEDSEQISVDDIIFKFNGDTLIQVKLLNE